MKRFEIGRVIWPDGKTVAILHVDRTWEANEEGLAEELAAIYRDHYQGPSHGAYGVEILDELAESVGGEAIFVERHEPPPGTVY